MTLLALFQPLPIRIRAARPFDWPALLRALAGHGSGLPVRLEDWQLRDLNLTRPHPGPGCTLTAWIP